MTIMRVPQALPVEDPTTLRLVVLCIMVLIKATVSKACPVGCNCPTADEVDCDSTNVCPTAVDPSTVTLRLSNVKCGSTLERSAFSHLTNLRVLEIKGSEYTSLDDHVFADTQLTQLTISGSTLHSFSPDSFAGLPHLSRLDLPGNDISVLPDNLLQHLTSLKMLVLQGNKLTNLSDATFSGLSRVESLDLSSNSIHTFDARCFHPLTRLRSLRLTHNQLATLPDGFMAGVPVTTLTVDFNELTSVEPDAFIHSSLIAFKMDQNNFTNFPTKAFQRLGKQIRMLYLPYNNIDKISAGDVAHMNIVMLDLSSNPLKTVEAGGFTGSTIQTLAMKNTLLTSLPEADSAVWTSLTKLDMGGVVDWECDCDSLWLANFFAGSAGSVSPVCSSATTGKDMKSSVPEIQAMCPASMPVTDATTSTTVSAGRESTTSTRNQLAQHPTQQLQTHAQLAKSSTQLPQTQTQLHQTHIPSTSTKNQISPTHNKLPPTHNQSQHSQPSPTHAQAHLSKTQTPTQTPLPKTPALPHNPSTATQAQTPLPKTPALPHNPSTATQAQTPLPKTPALPHNPSTATQAQTHLSETQTQPTQSKTRQPRSPPPQPGSKTLLPETLAPPHNPSTTPVPAGDDDDKTTTALIIVAVLGLCVAVCCAVLAVCVIHSSRSKLTLILQRLDVSTTKESSRKFSYICDPESPRPARTRPDVRGTQPVAWQLNHHHSKDNSVLPLGLQF